jgi:phosphopantetheine--protein transferase-like protein
MSSFEQIFRTAEEHGLYFGVSLPKTGDIPPDVWSQLHPLEQKIARTLQGKRKITFVGGRIAARLGLKTMQQENLGIIRDTMGAPIIANPHSVLTLSITHKSDQAIALVNRQRHVTVGIDLEHLDPPRPTIATKVLTPEELAHLHTLPEERQWCYLLMTFSFKESIYKALAPKWKRYIGFEEAIVFPRTDMTAKVSLKPANNDILPIEVNARYMWHGASIITSVSARWR